MWIFAYTFIYENLINVLTFYTIILSGTITYYFIADKHLLQNHKSFCLCLLLGKEDVLLLVTRLVE